jgi:heme oxygenase (mycobilin-producing)
MAQPSTWFKHVRHSRTRVLLPNQQTRGVMAITRIFRVRITPELRAEFEEKFASISVSAVNHAPGAVSVTIHKPTKWAPYEYSIISQWESEEALKSFAGAMPIFPWEWKNSWSSVGCITMNLGRRAKRSLPGTRTKRNLGIPCFEYGEVTLAEIEVLGFVRSRSVPLRKSTVLSVRQYLPLTYLSLAFSAQSLSG